MDAVYQKHRVLCVSGDPGKVLQWVGGDGKPRDGAGSQGNGGSDGGDTGDIGEGENGVGGEGDGSKDSSAATLEVTLFTTVLAVSIAKTT